MKDVWFALNWMFGVLFLLMGITSVSDNPLAALSLLVIASLLLPPIRNLIYSKTQIQFPFAARAISIVVLLIVFGTIAGENQERESQVLEAQKAPKQAEMSDSIKIEKTSYFSENRERILSDIKLAIGQKEYEKVISISEKYVSSGDAELSKFYQQAILKLTELKKAEKTKKLLAELRTIPATAFEKKRRLYRKLRVLHPANENYKSKVNHYHAKVLEEEQKKQEAAQLKLRKMAEEKKKERVAAELELREIAEKKKRDSLIESQFSFWDGAHYNLEKFIKTNMNDPDSYDHVETKAWDRGTYLVVKTTFRGKNSFGGVMTEWVKAKVDLDGNILEIIEKGP